MYAIRSYYETLQYGGGEVQQHMVDTAVFAGHHAGGASTGSTDHPGTIAHAGIGIQRQVERVLYLTGIGAVVPDGCARFQVVPGQADAGIAYSP